MKKLILLFALVIYSYDAKSQDCSCTDYLYVGDPQHDVLEKFEILADGSLSLIDATFVTGIDNPHGIGIDINGFLYIGSRDRSTDGGGVNLYEHTIWKVQCDGTVVTTDAFPNQFGSGAGQYYGDLNNLVVTERDLYTNNGVNHFDICNETFEGSSYLEDFTQEGINNNWDLTIGPDGAMYTVSKDTTTFEANIYRIPADNNTIDSGTTYSPWLVGESAGQGKYTGLALTASNIFITYREKSNNFYSILKYDYNGNLIARYDDSTNNGSGIFGVWGIRYSESSGLLYAASRWDDCIAVINPTTLTRMASLAVPGGNGKALNIVTECCPTTTPQSYNKTICGKGSGERVYLQDFFSCDEGTICEGQWAESANTSSGNIVFDDCDLSIVVNGPGCATYILTNTNASSSCGSFEITFDICTEVITASISSNKGTCSNNIPNDNASITISSVINGEEAGYSQGGTYSGPAYGDISNIDVSSGNGLITGLFHNSEYTIRIWNGDNSCYVDYTTSTPVIGCCPNINCFGVDVMIKAN